MGKIGFIGLGLMGMPMAINIIEKTKKQVLGFDILEDKRKEFLAKEGIVTESVKDIAKVCNIIFLSLPSNEIVEGCLNELIEYGNEDTIIIDLSSTEPSIIQKMYQKAKEKNIHLIDSPVSGGEERAKDATLVLMCGGEKEIFDYIKPYLMMIGNKATYMGKSGSGSIAKLANNMLVGIHIAALGEAYVFAKKAGLDPDVLFSAIKDGLAKSEVMDVKMPKILIDDLKTTARVTVHQKDLNNTMQLANDLGVDIPLSKKVLDFMNEMEKDGLDAEDHAAIYRIYEKHMDIKIADDNQLD